MSKILHDGIISSPSLLLCSPGAQDRFPRLLMATDAFGCFEAAPAILKGKLYPYRPDMTEEAIASDVDEYAREKMLELWTENGRRYGFFVSWAKYNRVRETGDFKYRRKTPVPPSLRSFGGSLAACEAARAQPAATSQLSGNCPPVADGLPCSAPTVAEPLTGNCPPQLQLQEQLQEQKNTAQPPVVDPEVAQLEADWPPDVLSRVKTALESTRRSGRMAASKWLAFLKAAASYARGGRLAAAETYLECAYASEGKDERYLLGIIRKEKTNPAPTLPFVNSAARGDRAPEGPRSTAPDAATTDAYRAQQDEHNRQVAREREARKAGGQG